MGQISKSPLVFRVSDSNLVDEHPKDLLDFAWLDQPPHIDQPREDHAETDQSAPERGDETDRASPDSEHQSDPSETDRDHVQAMRENVQVDEKDGPSESGSETEQTQALEFSHSKNPPESEKEHAGEQGHSDNEVEVNPSVAGDDAREAHNQTSAEDETHHAPADETDEQDHEQESDETPVSGFAPSTGEQYLDMPMVFIEPTPIAYDTDESEEDFLHFFL